jgi:glycosyltransferase involved in cell wall biosynthesis
MPQKTRIIVDVTQLAHWTGKITGIPRVMDELAKRFYADRDSKVVFVSWVKDAREFCEIDFDQTILQRNGVVYWHAGDAVPAAAPAPAASATVRSGKQLLKRAVKKGLRITARISPQVSVKLEARAKQVHMQQYKKVTFGSGDLFFIPWGEWWDPNFTDRLVLAHEQGAGLVQVIHDIATTVWPQFYEHIDVNPTTYNARILPIADLVLCVSENTKRELVGWLRSQKLHVPRVEVFRLGDVLDVTKPQKPTEQTFVNAKLKGDDYIMCVGTIEAKKNHAMFYYVYKWAKLQGIVLPKLVIVGRRGWGTENIYTMMTNDPEIGEQFVFLHDASDENLSWLYDHCLFTVLPSFHEGWGIPIAESIARGVPNACSDTSSMTEIAEGFVEHFSPYSTDECLAAILKLLDPKTRETAATRAKQYRQTPWDDTYKQVKAYLETV